MTEAKQLAVSHELIVDRDQQGELLEESDGEDGKNDLALEETSVRDWGLLPLELEQNKGGEEQKSEDEQDDLNENDGRAGKRQSRDSDRPKGELLTTVGESQEVLVF